MSSIERLSQKPFVSAYTGMQDQAQHVTRRRPAPVEHQLLPTDKVELYSKVRDDFVDGGIYTVKHISRKNPNVIQIEDENGESAFVPIDLLQMNEEVAERPGKKRIDNVAASAYLVWP